MESLKPALLAAGAILMLAGCSSSGGGTTGVVPTPPPPAPTPPPPPPPPPPGANGLTSSVPFVVEGVGYRAKLVSGPLQDVLDGPPAADPAERVQFRYVEADGTYEILLPGFDPGRLQVRGYGGTYGPGGWQKVTTSNHEVSRGTTAEFQNLGVTLRRPAGPLNPDETLRYTSWGSWTGSTAQSPAVGDTVASGYFAYGVPTAIGDVPLSGSASYRATVVGETSVMPTRPWQEQVSGTAELRFDFGAGTLAGSMNASVCPWDCLDLGRYEFRDTLYARGATGFSGKFTVPNSAADSFFEGHFTGPAASELLARFQAPFQHPETKEWATMHGVWVGKRD